MLERLKNNFDVSAFLQGLAATAVIYALLFALVWVKGPEALNKKAEELASKTITIAHERSTEPPVPVDTVDLDTPRAPGDPLAKAPIDGLFESTEFGNVPQVRPVDKLTPFQAYKRPYAYAGRPMIALLVKDFGLSDTSSQKALQTLPADVTFLISPYSDAPEKWSTDARNDGHEIWLDVKFENDDYPLSDPGSQALLAGQSLKYNQDRLMWHLARASGYAGITGSTDYVFESASAILQPLMKTTFRHGLGFMEMNTDASGLIETLAVTLNAPYARASVFINDQNQSATQGSPLKELERLASERGYAIGILNPYDSSIEQIKTWIDSLEGKGYALAPVSAIAERQMLNAGPQNP